jgi:hypothetical protein
MRETKRIEEMKYTFLKILTVRSGGGGEEEWE